MPQRSFFRSLAGSIPQGLVVIDAGGKILVFSRAAEALFGYRESEALGRDIGILMPSPHRELHGGYIRAYLDTGERKIMGAGRRVMALHRQGHEIAIHLEVGEARFGDRRVFLGFVDDVSEGEGRQRRIQLSQAQLAHSSRVASIGVMASAFAHELNQPLSAIRNYLEAIAAMERSDAPIDRARLREALAACDIETARASEIVRRIRNFIATGHVAVKPESLADIVGEALALALVDGERLSTEVRLRLDKSTGPVAVDGIQIEQVIFNLVRNALQAMQGGNRQIIQIRSVAKGEMVEVIVEDSGLGLDQVRLEKLFMPFTTDKEDGLGLGLSICQTIIEGHGGRIWAGPSELGGAAFHFTLPRASSGSRQAP